MTHTAGEEEGPAVGADGEHDKNNNDLCLVSLQNTFVAVVVLLPIMYDYRT